MLPDQVQDLLHVLALRGHRDHRVLLGQHQAVLPVRPVSAVAVPGPPELEAVAVAPVRHGRVGGLDVHTAGLGHPPFGQQPFALPHPVPQVQQTEPGDRLGGGVQAAEAQLAPRPVPRPRHLFDAQRVQQPRPQVLGQRLTGDPLEYRRQRVRRGLVVREHGPRIPVGRQQQEAPDRFVPVQRQRPFVGLLVVPAGHRRHVAYEHRAAARVGDVGRELREVRDHRVVQPDQPLGDREAGGSRREALAEGVQEMDAVRRVRRPPPGRHHVVVPQDHETVRLDARGGFESVEECLDTRGVHALGGGGTRGQGTTGRTARAHAGILPRFPAVIESPRSARFPTRRPGTRLLWCKSDTR